MKVLFHGRLAQAIAPELDFDAPPGCSIAQLRDRLVAEHPEAAEALLSRRARACIGDTLVRDDHLVQAGDEVEFLPPVSGG